MNLIAKTAATAAAGGALVFAGASIASAQDNGDNRNRASVAKADGTDGVVRVASADGAAPSVVVAQAPVPGVVVVGADDDKPLAPTVVLKA
ncbi:hypothetical protein ACGFS9_11375 [Streptomyces sp. NPDC048566]|uniref:hypothetical protein n=1 Tax=Streptomyces sp. NPDC048566 TaxID=3365569 RepID=UPI003716EE95